MKHTKIKGVLKEKNKLFTENLTSCKGMKVYDEKLINVKDKEYRSWNPYKSKLAAAILKGLKIHLTSNDHVLYLGAATGTTASHISDIVKDGYVYAVENSPIAMNGLIRVSKHRSNVIPILADANHPDRYCSFVPTVDFMYQDISQRNQPEIFSKNIYRYLKKNGNGMLMVKARSIDVALSPKQAYERTASHLQESGITVQKILDLSPYEKDHAAVAVSF
jgi:fibrillarin-like pre-rRNA processing protein